MRSFLRSLLLALAVAAPATAQAAGTIPLAMTQQVDINGTPLAGCLLYFYVAGTVATPQNSFSDFGLTTANANPLTCDQTGRVPMFWLADGLIHARLTDASGTVIVDTTMQVLGPSSGGGGGGGTVDPTTIAATGDIKFRPTSETVSGWVKLNGQTIGSAASGATGRANADTQNLFVYLWTNCTNAHCPVSGGRGGSAVADFNANKQITLYDMRDKILVGRDCMENTCKGGLLSSNVTSGGGDGVDTPAAFGGNANTTFVQANLPSLNFTVTIPNNAGNQNNLIHSHGISPQSAAVNTTGSAASAAGLTFFLANNGASATQSATALGGALSGTAASGGSGTAFSNMGPFALGTWYQKL